MAGVFTSFADVCSRVKPDAVIKCFDDDGDGAIAGTDLTRYTEIEEETDDTVRSMLALKGFSRADVELLATDKSVRRMACDIFLGLAGERSPEWQDGDGFGPFQARMERGLANLRRLSRGELRAKGEGGTVPENTSLVGQVSQGCPPFIFSRDPNNPRDRFGPGGF